MSLSSDAARSAAKPGRKRVSRQLGLEQTFRSGGRPRKYPKANSSATPRK
jgi:hypothetical protein